MPQLSRLTSRYATVTPVPPRSKASMLPRNSNGYLRKSPHSLDHQASLGSICDGTHAQRPNESIVVVALSVKASPVGTLAGRGEVGRPRSPGRTAALFMERFERAACDVAPIGGADMGGATLTPVGADQLGIKLSVDAAAIRRASKIFTFAAVDSYRSRQYMAACGLQRVWFGTDSNPAAEWMEAAATAALQPAHSRVRMPVENQGEYLEQRVRARALCAAEAEDVLR
jgi:hypothetical protein